MPLKEHLNPAQTARKVGIEIRAARPADLEDLCTVMAAPGVIHGTLQTPWTPDQLRAQWFAPGRANDVDRFLVATSAHNDTVIGSISVTVRSNIAQRHIADIGMGVIDDFQGRGVGTALLSAACHYADSWLAIRRIELVVHADNAAGLALYDKFDFEREGVMRDYAMRDGVFVDAITMARVRPDLRTARA